MIERNVPMRRRGVTLFGNAQCLAEDIASTKFINNLCRHAQRISKLLVCKRESSPPPSYRKFEGRLFLAEHAVGSPGRDGA
jgi:hypothetical protein